MSDQPRPPGAGTGRLVFLDALRGLALVLMVLNHTGRWWQDGSMGWPRYYFIYWTMALAAPTFLFLVGFCLPLSLARTRGIAGQAPSTLWKYALRGGRLILAGLLLNLLVFPEDPVYGNGVLQTIGLGIIVAAPVGFLLASAPARGAVAGLAMLSYLAFGWSYAGLTQWVAAHPLGSRILFLEFPPWPWVALVLFALVPGEVWVERADRRSQARYMALAAAAGALGLATAFGYDWWAGTPGRWTFKRDFILNDHWTPRGLTALGLLGAIACLMALFYYLAEVRRYRLTWLVTFGQTALMLYFLHHFIVLTLVTQTLHLRFNNWWAYGLANLLLLALLLGMGRGWLELRRLYRERVPALGLHRGA
jgi:uncharacterized membrane protein